LISCVNEIGLGLYFSDVLPMSFSMIKNLND